MASMPYTTPEILHAGCAAAAAAADTINEWTLTDISAQQAHHFYSINQTPEQQLSLQHCWRHQPVDIPPEHSLVNQSNSCMLAQSYWSLN
jgi:hypothetical protein